MLHLMGLAVPTGMDGKVLTGMIPPGSALANTPVRYLDESAGGLSTAVKAVAKSGRKL